MSPQSCQVMTTHKLVNFCPQIESSIVPAVIGRMKELTSVAESSEPTLSIDSFVNSNDKNLFLVLYYAFYPISEHVGFFDLHERRAF